MRRLAAAVLLVAAAGCATTPRPDPSVNLAGEWEITAVNGEQTGGGERFILSIGSGAGWAQFGCNAGSGAARAKQGWLTTGDWIITAAGCPGRERFERRGFTILAQPLAIERQSGAGLMLRNRVGSLMIRPIAPVRLTDTQWTAVSINGHASPGRGGTVRFGTADFQANFGCNDIRGTYRQEGAVFITGMSGDTEKGCTSTLPSGVALEDFENWGFRVLRSRPTVRRLRPGAIELTSPTAGWMQLERAG
jgi:heat shock protein HslJ